jgi:hypothetical protein
VVGELSRCIEAIAVRRGGAARSENADMSSILPVKIGHAENPRFPQQRCSPEGKSNLTQACIVFGDVQAVNIRLPEISRYYLTSDEICYVVLSI